MKNLTFGTSLNKLKLPNQGRHQQEIQVYQEQQGNQVFQENTLGVQY